MPNGTIQPDLYLGPRKSQGFTLIELLVAIGVIAIVSAITVTGLRGAREAARNIQSIADLRSSGQLLLTWSSERQGAFFNVGLPPRPEVSPIVYLESPDGQLIQVDYLGQWYAWTRLLTIWAGERVQGTSGIYYAFGCFTDPSLWAEDPPPWSSYPAIDSWRIVAVAETTFPSQKAMMFRNAYAEDPTSASPQIPMFLVDGSATSIRSADIGPQSAGFYGGGPADPPLPGRDTLHGIHGYDIRR